jgi:CRP-like cAMP-binding protein/anti-anti-sigma regulatory factor
MPEASPARSQELPDGGAPATVATTVGRRGSRALVTVAGDCDLEFVTPLINGVDRLLATDVSEVWVDLRRVTAMTSIAAAALVRSRRRAARFRVGLVLVAGDSAAHRVLEEEGHLRTFRVEASLPLELSHVPLGAAPVAGPAPSPPRFLHDVTNRLAAPPRGSPDETHVLLEDAELAAGLEGPALVTARERLCASVITLSKGLWQPAPDVEGGLGLLILEGMIVRRVGHASASGAELLGPGDVLRGGVHPGEEISPWFSTGLRVLSRARIAVLDAAFTAQISAHPPVVQNLLDRAMARAHGLTVSMAVAHYPRVDRRLLVLLWYLAQRWGRVSARGVVLRLPLTHSVLADLTASRRPSVTLALRQLELAGELVRDGADWILVGDPPDAEFDPGTSALHPPA